MSRTYDTIVIGGGVHGLATLYHLTRRSPSNCALIERFHPGHPHASSHGRTRITRTVYDDERWVALMRAARAEDWPRLERDAGAPLVDPCDGCFLGLPGATYPAYARAVAAATDPGEVEPLSPAEAGRRFPLLRFDDVRAALHDRTAGVIRADDTLAALARLARAAGADVLESTRVLAIDRARDPLVLSTDRGALRASRVVVTAGPWTAALVPELRAELTPVRQTVAHYRLDAPPDATRVGRFPVWASLGDAPAGIHFGLPERAGEGVKLARHETGGRADDPDELDAPPTDEALAHLDAVARARFAAPVLARVSSETCFYTNAAASGFRVGLVPGEPRIAVAAACSGHGFKLAPLVGRALAGYALHGASGVPELDAAQELCGIRASA